jgi:HD superfamily phosphohydrolase
MSARKYLYRDPLYGRVQLDEELSALAAKPIVQRLRHVRLSNIDSIDLPGIANISRFEHVLGVTHLASQVAFRTRLSQADNLVLQAAALLHDWAITAFGHLVEEALQYVGTRFNHAERLREIASGVAQEEILDVGRQILVGRENGLPQWISSVTKSETESRNLLAAIAEVIVGEGRFGGAIAGDIDLDNIDNVFRMAYHMGLDVDRTVPLRLARAMVDFDSRTGNPIFRRTAEPEIEIWRKARSNVYENLMLARSDFAGKAMLLFATIRAFEEGEIRKVDWSLTDVDFMHRLLSSKVAESRDAAERWVAGELWDFVPLRWMGGERPDYPTLLKFGHELSTHVDRTCFAYGIKDKRNRRLSIHFDDSSVESFGENPTQWLLGVGSPERRSFTSSEIRAVFDFAKSYLDTSVVGRPSAAVSEKREIQPSFL